MTRVKCTWSTQTLHLYHGDKNGPNKAKVAAQHLECPIVNECFLGTEKVRTRRKGMFVV